MPKMPKWLGDFSEKFFKSSYHPTVVSEIEYYHKRFKRVRYQGEALKSIEWIPAQEVEFRVTDTEYRHYTPSVWNNTEGYVDVLFYLHGKGPGSLWADKLKVGDEVLLIGPGGKFVPKPEEKNIIMLGDETTLSAFYGMQKFVAEDVETICVLEMNEEALDWHTKIGLEATILETKTSQRGEKLYLWTQKHLLQISERDKYSYYISGNANTIKEISKLLINCEINPKLIYKKPYWKEGKKGL